MKDVRDWWLAKARALPVGTVEKISHISDGVGKTDSVLIYNTPTGYGAKCFRRGTKDWVSKVGVNLAEVNKALEESGKSNIPDDLVPYNPTASDNATKLANTYLLARNIDPMTVSSKGGVFLSPSRMRLVFYGEDTSGNSGATGRDITEKHKAKSVVYWDKSGSKLQNYVYKTGVTNGLLVITEDNLSALKIRQAEVRGEELVVGEAISLNGTSGSPSLSLHCMDRDVIIWLDGDTAGEQGAVKLYRDLHPLARSVKIITGTGDPKDYSLSELRDIIWTSKVNEVQSKINIQEVL